MTAAAEVKRVARVLAAAVDAIESGSERVEALRSDASGDWMQGYADGWAGALTAAKVAAATAGAQIVCEPHEHEQPATD